MKKIFLMCIFLMVIPVTGVMAQCAMCRSTLENNFSNGDPGIAAGLNIGILYLLALPYLAVIVVGLMWYKSTRNGRKNLGQRIA